MKLRVTPAGLFEWCGVDDSAPADLAVQLHAANPAALFVRSLAGEAPALQVAGDAALATDIQWLIDNLRWDVESDLERVLGPVVAHQLARLGSSLAAGLRALSARASWLRPRGDNDSRGPTQRP